MKSYCLYKITDVVSIYYFDMRKALNKSIDKKRIIAIISGTLIITAVAYNGFKVWDDSSRFEAETKTVHNDFASKRVLSVPSVSLSDVDFFSDTQNKGVSDQYFEDAPESNLRLTLRGSMSNTDTGVGSVLVEDSSGETKKYVPGDMLPGNAKLIKVLDKKIIIDRNGQKESIYLPKLKPSKGVQAISTNKVLESSSGLVSESTPGRDARRKIIKNRLEELKRRFSNK